MTKKKVLSKLNPLFLKGIAHRGLHNEQFTENGMKAFENAIKHGVPLEFDLHLTKDNQLVVCHDEDLKRTTGKEGIIEYLTLKEIKENYHLLDGGEIPTFEEVLDLVHEQVPIVIELKVYEKNYKPLAKRFKEVLMPKVKDKKNYMIISFDPRSLWPLKRLGIIRSLLVAKSHIYVYNYFRWTIETVDLEQVLFDEKRIQKYHKRHLVNAWTIESEEQLYKILPYVDTVTFQHMDERVVNAMLSNKEAMIAVKNMRDISEKNGNSNMALDEINEEISKARKEKKTSH